MYDESKLTLLSIIAVTVILAVIRYRIRHRHSKDLAKEGLDYAEALGLDHAEDLDLDHDDLKSWRHASWVFNTWRASIALVVLTISTILHVYDYVWLGLLGSIIPINALVVTMNDMLAGNDKNRFLRITFDISTFTLAIYLIEGVFLGHAH